MSDGIIMKSKTFKLFLLLFTVFSAFASVSFIYFEHWYRGVFWGIMYVILNIILLTYIKREKKLQKSIVRRNINE